MQACPAAVHLGRQWWIVYSQAPYFPETEIASITQTEHDRVYNRPVAIDSPKQSVLLPPVRQDSRAYLSCITNEGRHPQQPRNPEVLPPEEPNHDDDSDEYDLFH